MNKRVFAKLMPANVRMVTVLQTDFTKSSRKRAGAQIEVRVPIVTLSAKAQTLTSREWHAIGRKMSGGEYRGDDVVIAAALNRIAHLE